MNNRLLLLALMILLSSSAIIAQDIISADRPGAGYGTYTVPTKTFYIESGLSLNETVTDFGQLYVRTGLTDKLEIQFGAGSLLFIDGVDKPRVAVQSVAFKYNVGSFQDEKLNVSLVSRTNLPFFNSDYEYYFTRFILLGDYSINDTWAVNSNFGYGDFLNGFENGSFNFNVTPGVSIQDNLAAYFGYAVTFDENFSSDLIEGGIQYFLNNTLQLDGGIILDGNNLYITAGIAKSF